MDEQQVPQTNQVEPPKTGEQVSGKLAKFKWLIISLVGILLFAAGFVWKDVFVKRTTQQNNNTNYPQVVVTDRPDYSHSENPYPDPNQGTNEPTEIIWVDVAWHKDAKSYDCSSSEWDPIPKCLIVGTLKSGEYSGKELVLAPQAEMGGYSFNYYPLISNQELGPNLGTDYSGSFRFRGVHDAPETLDLPNTGYKLSKAYRTSMFADSKIVVKLFDHPTLGAVYLMDNGCIMVELPDKTGLAYNLDIPFTDKSNGEVKFTLLNGTENKETYQYNAIVGCGAICYYLAVQDEAVLKPQQRLKVAAKTSNGEDMYELVNSNDTELKELYNDKNTVAYYSDSYEPSGQSKYTYEQFLSYKPLLYWKDPIGRWIEFKNQRFLPAAEMCKPVIYLYPKTKASLTVKVFPNGGFTYTDPKYENGWDVTANPNGEIVDNRTGKTHPYLFWEGIGLNYPVGDEGWVVAQKDVEVFLKKMLPQLGLVGREQTDFLEYWVDRLTEAPYYRLAFLKQEQFNEIAPLEFEGEKPDSYIRVMMTAKGLNTKETSRPQELQPPHERVGFSFVEWGGVVLK